MAKEKSPVKEKRKQMKKDVAAQKKEYRAYLKESGKELREMEKELGKLEREQYAHSKTDPLWFLFMILLIAGVWALIFFVLTSYGVLELPWFSAH